MMRMTVLASGSKGNSTVISSSRTRVLVDAGLSCRELLKRMSIAGEDPARLDAILITHEHQDHIAGLSVLARRLNIPVFFTEPTHRAWVRMLTPRTTMTYAKWLDLMQREKEARATAVAASADAAGQRAAAAGCWTRSQLEKVKLPGRTIRTRRLNCRWILTRKNSAGLSRLRRRDRIPRSFRRWNIFMPARSSRLGISTSRRLRFRMTRLILAGSSSNRRAFAWRWRLTLATCLRM